MRPLLDKSKSSWQSYKENFKRMNKIVKRTLKRWKFKRWRWKRRSDNKRPTSSDSKFRTKRKPFKIHKINKSKRSRKNIISRRSCSKPFPSALNLI
jgi:hypothetical protein